MDKNVSKPRTSKNVQNNKKKKQETAKKTGAKKGNSKEKRQVVSSPKKKVVAPKKAPQVEEKKKVIRKKIPKKVKRMITFLVLLAMVVVVGVLFCTLSIFDVKTIQVSGNHKYTSSQIVASTPLKVNQNIFLQYFTVDKENCSTLPYVQSVKINLNFPDHFTLEVTERESRYVAFCKEKNKFYRLDKAGYILEETTMSQKTKEEVLVYGVTFNNTVVLGEQINEIDLSKLQMFERIAEEYAKSDINANITKVDFENSLTTLTLNDKLIIVLPNDTNLKYNLDLLNSIMKKGGISSDSQGIIDMTKPNPVYSAY